LYEVHLVYETEDLGARTALMESANDVGVRDDIGSKLARFDVENEDEDGNGAEDVVSRLVKVVLDKAVLTATSQFRVPAWAV